MKLLNPRTIVFIGAAIVALSGCVYRMDIPQGNSIDADIIEQLEIGMSRNQVLFLLGSPAVIGPYQPDQWHYVHYYKTGKSGKIEQSVMTLQFTGDLLQTIEGDLTPG